MPPLPTRYTSKQYGGQKAKFTKAMEVLESTTKEIEEDIGYVTTPTEREKLKKYLTQAEDAIEKVQEFLEVHGEHKAEQVRADHTPLLTGYQTRAYFSIKRPLFVSLLRATELTQ